MVVSAARQAATTFGCCAERPGRTSSMMGAGTSSSMYNSSASIDDVLVAALVDDRPFSTMDVIVWPRVLTHASRPPNFKKAHNAALPSCWAATLESATTPFHRDGSCRKGQKAGSVSSGVSSNFFVASSYACFRTFHNYRPGVSPIAPRTACAAQDGRGRGGRAGGAGRAAGGNEL